MAKARDEIGIAGVRLTSPDRVLYAGQGITKRDLAQYYETIAEWILPQLAGRPLTLLRCPAGQQTECFVQRRASESLPAAVRRVEVAQEDGTATHLMVDSVPGLLSLVQLGVLELHTWSARSDRLDRPDRMILDLDPDPELPWTRVVEAAMEVRGRLAELGLESFVKTTGGKGLHVVVPLERRHSWEEVRDFSRALARELVRRAPERYVAQAAKVERSGRIYVDYLRNAWGASAVAAYSTRARPDAPVSTPLGWEELGPLRPDAFTLKQLPARLSSLAEDPWTRYASVRQRITRTMREAVEP
ncbi:MAG TPA: non-homologous end-joining DNA ligase [Longimicrobiaceae bacterium]|nr:non-homologous end-joining DNA ligase [Longimicrobiaceae bacterium]